MRNNLDVKIKLLQGNPVPVNDYFNFTPKTLEDIADMSFSKTMLLVNIFFIDLNKIKASFSSLPELDKASPFQTLLLLLSQGGQKEIEETKKQIIDSLNFFTDSEWFFDEIIHNNKVPLTEEDWFRIRELIAIEFGIDDSEPEEYNLANEKAKQFREKRKQLENQVKKIKEKKQDENDFSDLISAVAAKTPGINIVSVWQLTMYQITDQLKRINLIDTYEFNLRALLAGADSKKIDVQHWTSKI